MKGHTAMFRVAMRPGKRRALPDTEEGRLLDLVELAKAHVRSKVRPPFRVIKQLSGFQKTRLGGMAKNCCKVNVMSPDKPIYGSPSTACEGLIAEFGDPSGAQYGPKRRKKHQEITLKGQPLSESASN